MIYNILLIVQIIVALGVIGLVLVQHGKGADAGAAFGGGASGTVFGSRGAANFLSRSTAVLALVFFINSMALAWLVSNAGNDSGTSIVDTLPEKVEEVLTDVPGAPEVKAPVAESVDVPSASTSEEAPEQSLAPADVPQ